VRIHAFLRVSNNHSGSATISPAPNAEVEFILGNARIEHFGVRYFFGFELNVKLVVVCSIFFESNGKRLAVIFIRRSFNSTTEKRRVSVEQH
jgi:hypothetical protein